MKISALADKNKLWGYIKFIHKDGGEHEFYSCVNKLSKDRLSAIDNCSPSVNDSLKWVKSIFKNIFTRSKNVLEFEGNILDEL